jgi:REP element-mobilizing transposase RayT
MNIFGDRADYILLLTRLREALFSPSHVSRVHPRGTYLRKQLPAGAFTMVCYALMPNHNHLLIRQNTDVPLGILVRNVFSGYSKCFNKKYGHVGSIFQDQFKAVHIDSNEYLVWLSAYIHANPLVAGLASNLVAYPYTSYLDFIGKRNGTLCDSRVVLEQFKDAADYARFVEEAAAQILLYLENAGFIAPAAE